MNKKLITTIGLFLLMPAVCLGSNGSGQSFNWGTIIGSVIVIGIFALALVIEEKKKKGENNFLYKKIDTSGIKQIFRIILTAVFLFGMISIFFLPFILSQQNNDKYNLVISIIITVVVMLIYKKISKDGKY